MDNLGLTNKKINRFNKIARIIYAGFFAFFIFIILLTLIVPHGMIKVFGLGYYRVSSPSMQPTINVDDYVLVKRVKVNSLEEGDIIVFETKRQVADLEMVEKIVVIHYFGFIDDEGHIFTYPEANKDMATSDENKYDTWGTDTNPYFVTASDVIGLHQQTISAGDLMAGVYKLVYSPYFYLAIAGLTTLSLTTYYLVSHKKKKDEQKLR